MPVRMNPFLSVADYARRINILMHDGFLYKRPKGATDLSDVDGNVDVARHSYSIRCAPFNEMERYFPDTQLTDSTSSFAIPLGSIEGYEQGVVPAIGDEIGFENRTFRIIETKHDDFKWEYVCLTNQINRPKDIIIVFMRKGYIAQMGNVKGYSDRYFRGTNA